MSWKTIENPNTGLSKTLLGFHCRYLPWKLLAIEKPSGDAPLVLSFSSRNILSQSGKSTS